MKRVPLLVALLLVLFAVTNAQSNPPLTIREADGVPAKTNASALVFPNGTLTVSGGTVTYTASGGGGGTVTGTGTTGQIPLWTNGPSGVLGDSLILQTGALILISPAQLIARTIDQAGQALNGLARFTVASTGVKTSGIGTGGLVQTFSVGATLVLNNAACFDASYLGLTNTAGSQVDKLYGLRMVNWAKSNETIVETVGVYVDNSFSGFSSGNTYVIKSISTAPSNLLGSLKLGATAAPAQALDVTGNALISGNVLIGTKLAFSATAPTISAGFGTSPAIAGTSVAFTVTIGTGGSDSTGTVTFPAATTGWVCQCTDVTTNASFVTSQTGGSTTTATLQNYSRTTGLAIAWTAADVLRCSAVAY